MGLLGLSDSAAHAFTSETQCAAMVGVGASLTPLSPALLMGRVTSFLLLHLRFSYGVIGDEDLHPIWDVVARGKGNTEGLDTPN